MPYPAAFVEFFGPSTWKAMHSIAFSFAADPEHPTSEEQKAAVDFFASLRVLLPCPSCAKHYSAYLATHPIDTTNREALSRWVYDLHSDVNRRRHVPNLSYEEVRKLYTGFDPADVPENPSSSELRMHLESLADPHFGKPIPVGSSLLEKNSGSALSSEHMRLLFITFFAGAGVAFFIYINGQSRKRTRPEEENNKMSLKS